MIATMNVLGLDFIAFGNHEFDYDEIDITARMDESKFTWISSNVFNIKTNKSFHTSIPYKLLNIDTICILMFCLTNYVKILYLFIGEHEHEDYYLLRGSKYIPISKADANTFTFVTSDVQDDEKTSEIINYWFNLAIQGFEAVGFHPNRTVSCLLSSIELDDRFASVRNFPTLLSNFSCKCMVYATADSQTIIGLFDSGSIRIDDILKGTITEYDILRTLSYQNLLYSHSFPGKMLAGVHTDSMSLKDNDMFLSYTEVKTIDLGKT
ncbi:unnamed protein product [Rotaria sordida]|uniref:5'-Nucleotidase C-terminal domain-containing protein n=1 Tax=Rotaria sordida TaxID=392033 RepID=A0A819Q1Y6_9BILA|nr:unnamed protein product [Rotaria sordida]